MGLEGEISKTVETKGVEAETSRNVVMMSIVGAARISGLGRAELETVGFEKMGLFGVLEERH